MWGTFAVLVNSVQNKTDLFILCSVKVHYFNSELLHKTIAIVRYIKTSLFLIFVIMLTELLLKLRL